MKPTIDTQRAARAYSTAFQRLRDLPGFDMATVLKAEAGSILKAWAGKVKVATQQDIDRRARAKLSRAMGLASADKNPARITINNGRRGGYVGEVWFRTQHGFDDATKAARKKLGKSANGAWQQAGVIRKNGTWQPSWIHFKSADWARIDKTAREYAQRLPDFIENGRASAGLARQSVIQIAQSLGIDLFQVAGGRISEAGLAKGYAASVYGGYQNGRGEIVADATRGFVRLINTLPYNTHKGVCDGGLAMDKALALVLLGRAGVIERSYKLGVFRSFKDTARQFPNLVKVNEEFSAPLAA